MARLIGWLSADALALTSEGASKVVKVSTWYWGVGVGVPGGRCQHFPRNRNGRVEIRAQCTPLVSGLCLIPN